jgi:hypothetical protein
MKHLDGRLSALVDGELSHADRDRMLAHLAACTQCRAEATALRALKQRVAALGDADINADISAEMDAGLLARLLALTADAQAMPVRPPRRPRPVRLTYPGTRSPAGQPYGPGGPGRKHTAGRPGRMPGARRGVYVVASILSSVVVVIGGASFFAGGGPQGGAVPHITPAVDVFMMQHSVTTGEVPVADLIPLAPTGTVPTGVVQAGAAGHSRP